MSQTRYAVTVKKTRAPVSIEHYLDYLDYCQDLGTPSNVYVEDTRGLHIHFVLEATKGRIDFKKLKPEKYGWNVKAVPVYYDQGWKKYCRKDFERNLLHNELVATYTKPSGKFDNDGDPDKEPIPKRRLFPRTEE